MYLDRLRSSSSLSLQSHVDNLSDEIAEEMSRALANTAAKVNYQFAKLDFLKSDFDKASKSRNDKQKAAEAFNAQRSVCMKARTELVIHRQALGFKTNNHRAVEAHFPLPPPQKIT